MESGRLKSQTNKPKANVEAFIAQASSVISTSLIVETDNLPPRPPVALSSEKAPGASLDRVLDTLNRISYPLSSIEEQTLSSLLTSACQALENEEEELKVKLCQIIYKSCHKRQIFATKSSSLNTVLSFLSKCTTRFVYPNTIDALKALSAALFENGVFCEQLHGGIFLTLKQLVDHNPHSDVKQFAMYCFGNLCVKMGSKFPKLTMDVYTLLLKQLTAAANPYSEYTITDNSVTEGDAKAALKALTTIVKESPDVLSVQLETLVGCIKKCLYYGLQEIHYLDRTSQLNWRVSPRRYTGSGLLGATKPCQSSDSELSDGDFVDSSRRRHIRQNAVGCLNAIAQTSPKQLYPYWGDFFPDEETPYYPSLFLIMASSPFTRERMITSETVTLMLDKSRQYLAAADDRSTKSSFTSLSQKLGKLTRYLHHGLVILLKKETHPDVLTRLLKLCSVLISNSTYERLSSDYLPMLLKSVVKCVDFPDPYVKVESYKCLATILDSQTSQTRLESTIESLKVCAESNIVSHLIEVISSSEGNSLRVEACEACSALARHNFAMLQPRWLELKQVMRREIGNSDQIVRIAFMKLLDEYTKSQSQVELQELPWWVAFLEELIQPYTDSKCANTRALICKCISHIPSDIYAQLPMEKQIFILSLLLGLANDENSAVRAAASRALGVFVLFPTLKENSLFMMDASLQFVQLVQDPFLTTRIPASWALANLCDTLVIDSEENNGELPEGFDYKLLCQLAAAGIAASKDNDKLRSNGVRALGSLIRACSRSVMEREVGNLLNEMVNIVVKNINSGSAKTRWNACHATANFLRNPWFPIGQTHWTETVYDALLKSIQECRNFKVRIHACLALALPDSREKYSTTAQYKRIVATLVHALENVHDMNNTDFSEFKYQRQLASQLRTTLIHLLSLQTPKDQDALAPWSQKAADLIHKYSEESENQEANQDN
ncbi:ARM repeat-containing protein [Basidiobolus meristosporus CBS 931.73]|uniref:ARM repeat-containing protein n=2 Tax=Basidiobolus meristosporus CBS 931.73 TaxID=1314790 RepID=A0A1Y1YR22_9FUNG|nr:ARM repeat-containing protein [Basidiobolus meristosporus CBS 931.73]|eukprot:ORY00264.1 ARM repeat-containing protein [Basidiobolus meristosporus CBS 931.73]